jgi:hypothetical protein
MGRAGGRPAWLRVLLVGAAVVVGTGLLGRGLSGGGAEGTVLDVPPAGQATPARLSDGTPVFVSHEPSGDVHVVEARNPHRYWGLTTLVGWCPPAGTFESALDGSRFDVAGRHLIGPAPHGLATYEVTRNDRVVLVGARRDPQPRTPVGDPAVRDWCRPHKGGDVVTHEPDGTAELLALPGEPTRWCRGIEAADPPRCVDTVATLDVPEQAGQLPWSWEGPVLGSPQDPEAVQLLPGGQEAYPAVGTLQPVFGRILTVRPVPRAPR